MTKNLGKDNWLPGRELNRIPPTYEDGAATSGPRRSLTHDRNLCNTVTNFLVPQQAGNFLTR